VTALNWQMRAILPELREAGRLNVLIALLLHVNTRNRAYPGMDMIASETGFGLQAVTAAKSWLMARGAIILVPYKLRVEDERKLPARQHVYQLTGIIRSAANSTYEYLYMSPEARADIDRTVAAINVLMVKTFDGQNIRQSKLLTVKTEGSSSSLSSSNLLSSGSDSTRPNIFNVYEANIGILTPIITAHLTDAVATYPAGWVDEAIAVAVAQNKPSWAYAAGVLKRWERDGKDNKPVPTKTAPPPKAAAPVHEPAPLTSPFKLPRKTS